MKRLLPFFAHVLLAVALTAPVSASPQSTAVYPAKPIRMIVPISPGGSTDVAARIVAQKLTERWNHQVIVDNRPGAGGNIGTEIV
ncbi:MAG: tripartite tricarboxylate transporter substrate binding protein, partial [Burkholderiales bacterium]